jgi:hypothetical protein
MEWRTGKPSSPFLVSRRSGTHETWTLKEFIEKMS